MISLLFIKNIKKFEMIIKSETELISNLLLYNNFTSSFLLPIFIQSTIIYN